jgi:hypothetical protein
VVSLTVEDVALHRITIDRASDLVRWHSAYVTGTARLDRFRRDSGLRVPPVGRQWGRQANVSNGSGCG